MPVHDLGYRTWDGTTRPESERVGVIAETGVRLAWRSLWLRRILLVAWLPAVYFGLSLFMFENAAKNNTGPIQFSMGPLLSWLPGLQQIATAVRTAGPQAA